MFKVIKENSPVATAKDGFMRVQDAVKGDFAFIHDAATVRYEVRTNCDLKVIKSTRSCGLSNPGLSMQLKPVGDWRHVRRRSPGRRSTERQPLHEGADGNRHSPTYEGALLRSPAGYVCDEEPKGLF